MKKLLVAMLAACLMLTASACVNIDEDFIETLKKVDMNKVAEQLHVDELIDQLGINEAISQMIPGDVQKEPVKLPEGAVTDEAEMQFHTIGEARNAGEVVQTTFGDDYIILVFWADDVPYRVAAETGKELREALDNIDFHAEDYDEQFNALTDDLKIVSEEALSKYYPDQAELDALIGMTGRELQDAGYIFPLYNEDEQGKWVALDKGLFSYRAVMNEDLGTYEEFEQKFDSLTLKSIEILDLSGFATDLTVTD